MDFGLLTDPADVSQYEFLRTGTTERWVAMVPESHPLAERESLTPQNLKDAPLLFPVRTPVHNLLLNWFGQYADQARANIAGYCSLTNNAVVMVTNGLGLFLGLDLGMCYPGVRAVPLSPALQTARPSSGRNRPRPRRPPRNSPDSCWTEAYGPRIFSHGIEAWCRIPLLSSAAGRRRMRRRAARRPRRTRHAGSRQARA